MSRLDPAMMGAIDPRLQIREDKVDHWQVLLCLLWVTPERERVVPVANSGKVVISLPAVSADNGSRRYIIAYESGKRLDVAARKRGLYLSDARDDAEPEPASVSQFLDRGAPFMVVPPLRAASFSVFTRPHLDSTDHCRLMMGALTFATRATAYKAFVYLDGMRRADGVAVWPNHTGTKFVKHRECCLIGSNIKLALKLEGRLAGRLCRHEIGAPKPSRERHMARLHDCPGGERGIFLTGAATQHDRRARCEAVRLADGPALRAREAVRPADGLQVTGASAVIREDALKFRKTRWEGCIHV